MELIRDEDRAALLALKPEAANKEAYLEVIGRSFGDPDTWAMNPLGRLEQLEALGRRWEAVDPWSEWVDTARYYFSNYPVATMDLFRALLDIDPIRFYDFVLVHEDEAYNFRPALDRLIMAWLDRADPTEGEAFMQKVVELGGEIYAPLRTHARSLVELDETYRMDLFLSERGHELDANTYAQLLEKSLEDDPEGGMPDLISIFFKQYFPNQYRNFLRDHRPLRALA